MKTPHQQAGEGSLWLRCYKAILKTEPWYRSEKKIRELTVIMAIQILDERISNIEKSLILK